MKNVSAGFARNFLLPRRLAVLATPDEMKKVNERRKQSEGLAVKRHEKTSNALEKLNGTELVIRRKANDGTLYAGIHALDITEELARQRALVIDAGWIDMPSSLKSLGDHDVKVRFEGKEASFKIHIQAE